MKKITLTMLMVLMVLLSGSRVAGQVGADAYKLRNMVDVKDINIRDLPDAEVGYPGLVLSLNKIYQVDDTKTYTLVLSGEFYDSRDLEYDPFFGTVTVISHEGGSTVTFEEEPLIVSNDESHVYFEFSGYGSQIEFVDMIVSFTSYKVLLYEGSHEDYTGHHNNKSRYIPEEGFILVDFDNPKTIEEITSAFNVTDSDSGIDPNNPIKIIEDNYTANKQTLGEHTIKYMIEDLAKNRAFYNLTVKVMDIVAPTITGTFTYEFEYEQGMLMPTTEMIKNNLTVNDNHDGTIDSNNIQVTGTLPSTPTKDTFSIQVSVSDSSSNTTTKDIIITIEDTIPPTITGPSHLYRYQTDSELSLVDIRRIYQSYDKGDGDLTNDLTFTVVPIDGKDHEYNLFISSIDSAGNERVHLTKYYIIDGTAPIFNPSSFILTLTAYQQMSREELINFILEQTGMTDSGDIEILLDESAYINNQTSDRYLYFSYLKDGHINYGRILIKGEKRQNYLPLYMGISLIIFDGLVMFYFIKKRQNK